MNPPPGAANIGGEKSYTMTSLSVWTIFSETCFNSPANGRAPVLPRPALLLWVSVSAIVAVLLGAFIVAGIAQAVGREKLVDREFNVLEQIAGVFAAAAAAASAARAAVAVLIRHTVVEHRHQQLAVPLQTDDGKLTQGHKGPAVIVAHGQVAAEALADAGRNLADVAVTAPVLAALYQLCVQYDGVYRLHHCNGHIALLQQLAVQTVDTDLGGEDFRAALAAEENHALVKYAQSLHLDGPGIGTVGIQGHAVEKAHIDGVKAPVENDGFYIDVRIEQLRFAALHGLGAVEHILPAGSGIEPQILNAIFIPATVVDFLGMDTNGLAVLDVGHRAGCNTFSHKWTS